MLGATGPFLAGTVAVLAFGKSLQEFTDFEQTLNVFAATAEATGQQMEQVSELAKDLGADMSLPATSASGAATAMTELAKAGLTVEDAMGGARGVLQLATAAGLTVGEAAQFVANELNAFGLAGDEAVQVADVLANAANAAQGSISDFGLAFKQSAAVANLVGLSLEDTARPVDHPRPGRSSGIGRRHIPARSSLLQVSSIPAKNAAGHHQGSRDPVAGCPGQHPTRCVRAVRGSHPAVCSRHARCGLRDCVRNGCHPYRVHRGGGGTGGTARRHRCDQRDRNGIRTGRGAYCWLRGPLEGLKNTASTTALNLGELSTVIAGPLVFGLTYLTKTINLVIEPFANLVRLGKEFYGLGGTFDPASQSVAGLLVELRNTQDQLGKAFTQSDQYEVRIQEVIRALEGEQAALRAAGVEGVTGIEKIIAGLESELAGLDLEGPVLTSMQKIRVELAALIESFGDAPPPALLDAMKQLNDQVLLTGREGGRFTDVGERVQESGRFGGYCQRSPQTPQGRSRGFLRRATEGSERGCIPADPDPAILQGQEQFRGRRSLS